MSFNIEVEGGSSVRLPTAGKYCDRDIVITATGGGGDDGSTVRSLLDRTISGDFADSKITSVGAYAFYNCTKLTSIYLPNVTTADAYAFAICGAEVINLPKLTTLNGNDYAYNFGSCPNLTTLIVPELRRTAGESISGCPKLTTFVATKLQEIYYRGMRQVGLVKLDLPSCSIIATQALLGSPNLVTLILRNESAVCNLHNVNAFTNTPIASGSGYIYVPSALVESYKTATNWSTFANQIRAIEDYPDICGEVSA
jgi:hypothetical protein